MIRLCAFNGRYLLIFMLPMSIDTKRKEFIYEKSTMYSAISYHASLRKHYCICK